MKKIIYIIIIFISVSAFSQNFVDYTLPDLNRENFPLLEDTTQWGFPLLEYLPHSSVGFYVRKTISYSQTMVPSNIPFAPLPQGQTMRIKILLPPGCVSATITAQSNQWQSATAETKTRVTTADYDIGTEYHHNQTRPVDGNLNKIYGDHIIYFDDMYITSPSWNAPIFGSSVDGGPTLNEQRYAFCYLHFPVGNTTGSQFIFGDFNILYTISDYDTYEKWVLSQSWGTN